eukprot:g6149.t1
MVSEEEVTELQPVSEGDEDAKSHVDTDADSDFDVEGNKKEKGGDETLTELLHLSQTELVVLSKSWDMFMVALGGERETVGDAIFGALTSRLSEAFKGRPRAIVSLNLFNGFRLLCEKSPDPNDLKLQVETLAFKHLGNEITQQRVDAVTEAYLELMQQMANDLGVGQRPSRERAKRDHAQEDWHVIQNAQEAEHEGDESVTRSFAGMCTFSSEVIGQQIEGGSNEPRIERAKGHHVDA